MRVFTKLLLAVTAILSASGLEAAGQTLAKMTIATGVDPAFSQFYVAKEAGIFEKNGLDVTINTGPSGSAMVPFLIGNQVQAVYGSDLAGVINHNIDNNVIAVADGTYLVKWLSVVGRNVADVEGLKGADWPHCTGAIHQDVDARKAICHLTDRDLDLLPISNIELVAVNST